MADISQFKQQNQEIQDVVNEMPKIKCKVHENFQVEFINLSKNTNNLLICLKCASLYKINFGQLVIMGEVFSKNENEIIKNWPQWQDEQLYQELVSYDVQQSKTEGLVQKIVSYFEKFKQDIIKSIDDHQKKIFSYINIMEEDRKSVIEIYNQVSEKETIKKQILANHNNKDKLEDFLRKTIQEKQKQFVQDKKKLQESINKLTECQKKLKIDKIMDCFGQSLQTLQSFDFLNPIKSKFASSNVNIIKQVPILNEDQQVPSEINQPNQDKLIKDQVTLTSVQNLSDYQNYENIIIDLSQQNLDSLNFKKLSQIISNESVIKIQFFINQNKIYQIFINQYQSSLHNFRFG